MSASGGRPIRSRHAPEVLEPCCALIGGACENAAWEPGTNFSTQECRMHSDTINTHPSPLILTLAIVIRTATHPPERIPTDNSFTSTLIPQSATWIAHFKMSERASSTLHCSAAQARRVSLH